MPGMGKRFKFLLEVEVDQDIIPGFGNTIRDWVNTFMQSSFFTRPQYNMTGRAFRLQAGDHTYVSGEGYKVPKKFYPIDLDNNKIDHIRDLKGDNDLVEYLADCWGAVEATDFERYALWIINDKKLEGDKKSWDQNAMGHGRSVSSDPEDPTFISLLTAVVGGKKLLFYYATSTIVNHDSVRAWIEKNMPASARQKDGRVNHADANNFHNIFTKR